MNEINNNYNFKSLFRDRSLFWRYTWAVLIPLIAIILICTSIGSPLDKAMKGGSNLQNIINDEEQEKYAFIENNAIPPFYKEKFSVENSKFLGIEADNWLEKAQKDSINYILEFEKTKDSNTYKINIWTNNAENYEDLKVQIENWEFEKAGIVKNEIHKKHVHTQNNTLGEIYNYIAYTVNSLAVFFIIFFSFWTCRYVAIDAIQQRGNNSFNKSLSFSFLVALIAACLVLITLYRASNIAFNGSAMIAGNYIKAFITLKYISIMLAFSSVIAFLIANIWTYHNIALSHNLYKNMRNGNKYYLIIIYLSAIGAIGSLLSDGFIILPLINLFVVGKMLMFNTLGYIDILIFMASNLALGFLLFYAANKKYSAIQLLND